MLGLITFWVVAHKWNYLIHHVTASSKSVLGVVIRINLQVTDNATIPSLADFGNSGQSDIAPHFTTSICDVAAMGDIKLSELCASTGLAACFIVQRNCHTVVSVLCIYRHWQQFLIGSTVVDLPTCYLSP